MGSLGSPRAAHLHSNPSLHTYPHLALVHPQQQLPVGAKAQGDPWGSQQAQLVTELLGRDVLLAVTSGKGTNPWSVLIPQANSYSTTPASHSPRRGRTCSVCTEKRMEQTPCPPPQQPACSSGPKCDTPLTVLGWCPAESTFSPGTEHCTPPQSSAPGKWVKGSEYDLDTPHFCATHARGRFCNTEIPSQRGKK